MKQKLAGLFCLLGLIWALSSYADEVSPRMLLILDDLGVNAAQGSAALALPGPITYAVLPFTPDAKAFSEKADQAPSKEVILHAPMANLANLPLGPGGLYPYQSEAEFKQVLRKNLDSLPMAQGLNNHMGSLLTQQEKQMRWVMEVAKERGLFFIDSRTTALTQAANMAREANIPVLERNVFLDHQIDSDAIEQQFLRAIDIALQQGEVIVIGHPYPETLEYLHRGLPILDELGIQRVTASAFLRQEADLEAIQQRMTQEALSESALRLAAE